MKSGAIAAPELVVTIRLRIDSQDAGGDAANLVALLERLGRNGEVSESRSVVARSPKVGVRELDDIIVDADARTVTYQGDEIPMTRREFDLLLFLADNPRLVFSRAQLVTHVWGGSLVGQRSVDVHVTRLRNKLGPDVPLVSTLRGVGYRLHPESSVVVVRER